MICYTSGLSPEDNRMLLLATITPVFWPHLSDITPLVPLIFLQTQRHMIAFLMLDFGVVLALVSFSHLA